MKYTSSVIAFLIAVLGSATVAHAQATRLDALWAPTTTETITLDGVLSEPGWALAESVVIVFGVDNGVPGSGWKYESGVVSTDPTTAVLKFLVKDNQLYLGATLPDASIGGSADFNRFDGLLMSLKDHASLDTPRPPAEYFYVWWYEGSTDPQPAGQDPAFIGRWAEWPPGTPRTQEQIDNWDAVTIVRGLSNSDAVPDTGYTVEMRFNLTPMGYDVTDADGDVIEWNISIYDCDYFWPVDPFKFSSNRVWWQSPWGNARWYSQVNIHARPSVTIDNSNRPWLGPEVYIPSANHLAVPSVDGDLNDAIWAELDGTVIEFGNEAVRSAYDNQGPYRSGQFQPTVNGGQAAVLDPGYANFKMAHHGDWLYLAFDVNDQVVQYHPNQDRWDGFIITMNHLVTRNPDKVLQPYNLTFHVGETGAAVPQEYLLTLVGQGKAQVAIQLKGGTTVDTLGTQADTGYTAEVGIDLTALGLPSGLGDGTAYIGVNLLDGDSFENPADSYGTQTFWYTERAGQCCPAVAFLAPSAVSGVDDTILPPRDGYLLFGAFPNPAASTTIRFSLPEASRVDLDVFDAAGRRVAERPLGLLGAGIQEAGFAGGGLPSGMYFYRLRAIDPEAGSVRAVLNGRVLVVR